MPILPLIQHTYMLLMEQKGRPLLLLLPPHAPQSVSCSLKIHYVLPSCAYCTKASHGIFYLLTKHFVQNKLSYYLCIARWLSVTLRRLIFAIRYSRENELWIITFLIRFLSIHYHNTNSGRKGKNPLSKKNHKSMVISQEDKLYRKQRNVILVIFCLNPPRACFR